MANKKGSSFHLLLSAPLIFLVIGIMAFFSGVMRWLFPTTIDEMQTFPKPILFGAVFIGIGLFLYFYRRKNYLLDISKKEVEDAVTIASKEALEINFANEDDAKFTANIPALESLKTNPSKDLTKEDTELTASTVAIDSENLEQQKNSIRRALLRKKVPGAIQEKPLAYQYLNIDFNPVLPPPDDENTLQAFLLNPELLFSVEGDKAVLSHNGATIGEFSYKLDMISDFLSRSDIVKVFLSKWDMSGAKIHLCFYRDHQKPFYGRPFESVRLIKFTNESAQDALLDIACGSKLDYDEDYDQEGKYFVFHYLGTIGNLPSAVAKKLSTTDIDAIFLERLEVDEEKELLIPYVRIYWSQN